MLSRKTVSGNPVLGNLMNIPLPCQPFRDKCDVCQIQLHFQFAMPTKLSQNRQAVSLTTQAFSPGMSGHSLEQLARLWLLCPNRKRKPSILVCLVRVSFLGLCVCVSVKGKSQANLVLRLAQEINPFPAAV